MSGPVVKESAAAQQLAEAMDETTPACAGDERFTSDAARADDGLTRALLRVCWRCPLLEACEQYATETKPAAGFWAGKWRGSVPREAYLARVRRKGRENRAKQAEESEVGAVESGGEEPAECGPFPAGGNGQKGERPMNIRKNGASSPPESQSQAQTPRNHAEAAPRQRSKTDIFARQHYRSRRQPCPACGAAARADCSPVEGEAIRRRGPRWHHRARWSRAQGITPRRAAERANLAAAIHSAPTSKSPKPSPPPTQTPKPGPAPAGSFEARLRAALTGVCLDDGPEAVQAARR